MSTSAQSSIPSLSGMKVKSPAVLGASLLPFCQTDSLCVLFLSGLPEESRLDRLHSALSLKHRWTRTPRCPARRSPSPSPTSSRIPPRCSAPCTSERPSDFPFTPPRRFLSAATAFEPPPSPLHYSRCHHTALYKQAVRCSCGVSIGQEAGLSKRREHKPFNAQWWR